MAKKKTTPAKPKAVKPEAKKKEEAVSPDVGNSKGVESIISPEVTQDTGKEKELLKSKEIAPKEPDTSKEPGTQLTFEEANAEMDKGILVSLPKWEGAWFKKIGEDQVYQLTAAGDIAEEDISHHSDRNDFLTVKADEKQQKLLDEFWASRNQAKIDADNRKQLEKNNGLKALYFTRGAGGSFSKVKGKLTVEQLTKRQYPAGTTLDSEFLLENGKVFSVKEGRVTNKDLSNQLQILKNQK